MRAPEGDFEPVYARIGREMRLPPDRLCVVMNSLLVLRNHAAVSPSDLQKIKAASKDLARVRRQLSKMELSRLRAEYADMPAVARVFDVLIRIEETFRFDGLPDAHVDVAKRDCARLAYFTIKEEKLSDTMGELFPTITSLFYEYVTGAVGANCERACRAIMDENRPK